MLLYTGILRFIESTKKMNEGICIAR